MSDLKTKTRKEKIIEALWRRPSKWWLLGIPLGGFVMIGVGALGLGTANTVLHATSTNEFCTSCHSMKEFVFEDYKKTVHFQNASGVRAECQDCHIPKPWFAMVTRKTTAGIKDVTGTILGTIDTREKFEANRLRMAESVWEDMRENDSRECRSCHALESMALHLQDKSAQKKHSLKRKLEKNETCIDCHQGVAHSLPGSAELSLDLEKPTAAITSPH